MTTSRRRFIANVAVDVVGSLLAAGAAAKAGQVARLRRGKCMVMACLGGEHPCALTDTDNFNPLLPQLSRNGCTQDGAEGLFYYAPLTHKFTPWLAESLQYGNNFNEGTVVLRKDAELYHMRHFKPNGQDTNNLNNYRWQNKPFSDFVDQMGQVAEDDPKLKDLWLKALEIWLQELPDVQLVQTIISVPMNTTYWTGWPSAQDPYVREGFWHRNALHMFLKLQPVG